MDKNVNNPQISVIMPVYNASMFLRDAIESILNQTFKDFEFFIVDDKSSDNSLEIIKSYKDDRITVIENLVNQGVTNCLNSTILICKGKYIARMDADDISLPDRFLEQYNYLEANEEVLVLGTSYDFIGETDLEVRVPTGPNVKLTTLIQTPVAHPTVMMRKIIFTDYHLFYDKSFEPAEDYDLWSRVLSIGVVENIPKLLLHYRIHASQVSQTNNIKQIQVANLIRQRELKELLQFNDSKIDSDFAVKIITKQISQLSTTELYEVKRLLRQLYKANRSIKKYNAELFYNFLKNIWSTYLFRIEKYHFRDIGLLLKNKETPMCSMPLVFNLKYIIKTIIK